MAAAARTITAKKWLPRSVILHGVKSISNQTALFKKKKSNFGFQLATRSKLVIVSLTVVRAVANKSNRSY